MFKKMVVLNLAMALMFSVPVLAMEFSAEMVSKMKGTSVASKIYFSGKKWRSEMDTKGHKSISIVRMDKKIMWNIMPQQKMYMEMKIPEQQKASMSKDVPGQIKREKMGRERINGIDCEKYKITYKDTETGKTGSLYQWLSKDDLPIKTEAADGSWSTEMKNLKKGKQPSSLFEIPAGYKKYVMPAMPQKGKIPVDYMKMMKEMPKM